MQIPDRFGKFAADGAAKTTRLQQDRVLVDSFQEMMIQAHFAKFVDEHGGIGKVGISEQAVEQGCLSGPEKTRNQVYRCELWDLLAHAPLSSQFKSAGSSGSQSRPVSCSATDQRWERLSTSSLFPVAVERM